MNNDIKYIKSMVIIIFFMLCAFGGYISGVVTHLKYL